MGSKQRLEMHEDSSTEEKTWQVQVYSLGRKTVFRFLRRRGAIIIIIKLPRSNGYLEDLRHGSPGTKKADKPKAC